MSSTTKDYLPNSNGALISWLENFLKQLNAIGKFLGIEKSEIDFLESMILSIKSDIKLSNGNFSRTSIDNLRTRRQEINIIIDEIITKLEKHPLYLKDFHGRRFGVV